MKDNKKNKTFAARATQILKSYKRADWDPIEKAALESSLEKLQQEQESYKQANQIEDYSQEEMANGGNIYGGEDPSPVEDFYMDGINPSSGFRTVGSPDQPYNNGLDYMQDTGSNDKELYLDKRPKPIAQTLQKPRENTYLPDTKMSSKSGIIPTNPYEENLATSKLYPKIEQPEAVEEGTYSPYKTSITPSIISGATSVLGNMYLANQQKGNDNIKLPRLSTPKISLERSRQAASREATRTNQRIKYASKGVARTRGEYASNRIAGEAQVSGKLGETLSASHEKESLVNANMKLGMSKYNAEMKAKETMINQAQKIKNKKEREAYLSAAMSTIGKATANINAAKQKDAYINMMGDDYGMYMYDDPNRKPWQSKEKVKAYRNKATGKVTKR